MNGFDEPIVAPLTWLDRTLLVAAVVTGCLALGAFLWGAVMLIKAGG